MRSRHVSRAMRLARVALAAVLLVACDDKKTNTGPPTKVGEIGAALYTYGCAGDSDAQCDVDAELAPKAMNTQFPRVASGSRLSITAARKVEAGAGAMLSVAPVGVALFDVDAQTKVLSAKRAGWGSLLAMDNATVVDLTAISIGDPKTLKLLQATPDGKFLGGSVTIGPGGVSATANVQYTFRFRALPLDDRGQILAGALPCAWTTSDANVAKLTSNPADNIAVVVSGAAGTATVKVTLGPLSGEVAIKVN